MIAETNYGKIKGQTVDGIHVFKGIPYGASTAGKNRFMPPRPPESWTGVRDALNYGPCAPQPLNSLTNEADKSISEDCLRLNIWAPLHSNNNKRPVMLWLHGGGFGSRSGSSPDFDGTNLAKNNNALLVTLNHRLNFFGFTHLGDLADPEFAQSGVVGLLDIIAALKWVRDNIEKFGGDPQRVLLFGESGGGRKISTLMAMPDAKGLFHRAAIQSGALLRLKSREDGTKASEILMNVLGLKSNQVQELQNLPMEKLIDAIRATAMKIRPTEPGMAFFSPTIGCDALPHHPWESEGLALHPDIPMIVGYNRTEGTWFKENHALVNMTEADLKTYVTKRIGAKFADQTIEIYRKNHPNDTPYDLYMLIYTDYPMGAYARELAKRKASQNRTPVFMYRFDWETPLGDGHKKSPHELEIPFVFNNTRTAAELVGNAPESHELARKMSTAWATFATTGNPNTPDLPKWPHYTPNERATMLFNNTSRIEKDPNREERLVMEKILKLT